MFFLPSFISSEVKVSIVANSISDCIYKTTGYQLSWDLEKEYVVRKVWSKSTINPDSDSYTK